MIERYGRLQHDATTSPLVRNASNMPRQIMARHVSVDDVRDCVKRGKPDELIGVAEDEHVEAKHSPYLLDSEAGKFEFAKDATSLANGGGGVIVIGFRTARPDPARPVDTIVEVVPFPPSRLNHQQYVDILTSWVYPPLHVDIEQIDIASNRIVAAIYVPAEVHRAPFLTTRTVASEGTIDQRIFSFFERRRAVTKVWSVEEMQAAFKVGRQGSADLHERIQQLEADIRGLRGEKTEPVPVPTTKVASSTHTGVGARVEAAIQSAKLDEAPAFYFAADPSQPGEIPGFLSDDSAIAKLVQNPPEVRSNGFDLTTGEWGGLIEGRLRRAALPGYKLLEVFRDGTVIFVATGESDFIAWGSGKTYRLNPLVLAEVALLFSMFVDNVINEIIPRPALIEYRLGFRRLNRDEQPALLVPAPLGTAGWELADIMHSKKTLGLRADVAKTLPASDRPERVAAVLLEEFYGFFGISAGNVPYVDTDENGNRVVVAQRIRQS